MKGRITYWYYINYILSIMKVAYRNFINQKIDTLHHCFLSPVEYRQYLSVSQIRNTHVPLERRGFAALFN